MRRAVFSQWSLIYFFGGSILCLLAYHCRILAPHWPAIKSCLTQWLAGG